MRRTLTAIIATAILSPTFAGAQQFDTHPRILSGYTGAFVGDEDDRWREYLPLLADHGFTVVDFKLHPSSFPLDDDASMREFVHEVATAVDEAGLDFYIYLYDRGASRDPEEHTHLSAFMSKDGTINPEMYCLYSPEVWLELFERVFWMAERSTEVPIAGVKIDIEHLQNYQPCVCDTCFADFVQHCGEEATAAPGDRWAWIGEHGGQNAYMQYLESRVDEAAKQYEARAHEINPDLCLGMMPVRDSHLHRPWMTHLATERAPAIMDSWAMYGGLGWTDSVAELQDFVKSLNPYNYFVPWFRPNNYRPEDMGRHAFVAAVEADGYNLWQLNMLHPEQIAARRDAYALPTDYTDPMAYWAGLGGANARVQQWLADPHPIDYEPIEMLLERADIGDVTIPDLRPMAPDTPARDEEPVPTGLRGVNTVYVHVNDPAEPIRAEVRHVAGERRNRPIAWALAKGPDQPVAEGRVTPGETADLSIEVPETGTYALVLQAQAGGGPWYSVRVLSHPHGVSASGKAYYFRRSPRQYFWVPEGLESFRVRAETGRRNQEMRVQVWRPDGEQVLDHVVNSDVAHRETLEITVLEGMSGAVWSLHVGRPDEMEPTHYSENYYVRIMDAEPWLAERPGAVLGR
ncbi:MAG: hypothetical protein GF393_06040 [Armatimonadia bacterium]|nr:hypothetical protein [Armatimonadia bacterium]